jgi:hypothetical protein
MTVRKPILLLTFAVLLGASGASLASSGHGTPDGSPPADEAVCEDAGLKGAAYGLCVAFCEANDCDQYPDSQACEVLRANYEKITGEQTFPCEEITPPPAR